MKLVSDIDVLQWFFDLEPVSRGFNWPVGVQRLLNAKRSIDTLTASDKSSADEVRQAYTDFATAVGPTVFNTLLQSDDAFTEVNHSGKPTPPAGGKVTLFVAKDGRRVLAQCNNEWGQSPILSIE